jgi:predicted permease
MLSDLVFRLRSLFRRHTVEAELDDELRFHFEQQVEKCIRSGMAREEARRQARLSVGGIDQVKEECRDARGVRLFETLLQDLRYGWRMLRRKPVFTVVAVVTLALGVGANTAMFSIVNAVLLRSLPFRSPDRLVRIYFNNPGVGMQRVPFSIPELEDLRTRAGVFEDVTALGGGSVNLTGGKEPERLEMLVATPNYFSMLGTVPQIGRLFGAQDFALGFAPLVVISDSVWRRSYGADANVVGRTIRLDSDPYTIIGVLPPEFRHPGQTLSRDVEVFCTAGFSADPAPKPARGTRFIPVAIGRLKPGLTLPQAQARLTAMAIEIRRDFGTDYAPQANWTIEIESLQDSLVGNFRPMLLVLMGAVILVVFLVALNIANLLLARASGRQQEMAVRLALGASRSRMVRQMLTESVLLSLVGGAAGVATAAGTWGFILRLVPPNIPRLHEVSIDWPVLGFALLISLLTGLAFGLAPAIQFTRSAVSPSMREGARGVGYGAKTGRLRDALVVCELALAVVLMVGAGLLLRTLRDLLRENPGFNPTQVVSAHVNLPVPNDPVLDWYSSLPRQNAFNRELLRRMSAIPGVEQAGSTSDLPATGVQRSNLLAIEDRAVESSQDLRAEIIRASPGYFKLMQVPLESGRFFDDSDDDGKPPVAIVDEATARRYWPNRDPIGRRIRFGQDPTRPWITVVGIVRDIKNDGLDAATVPHIYTPMYQNADGAFAEREIIVVLRTSLPAAVLEPRIRHEIQSIDASLPVFNIISMNNAIDASLASRRFSADLVGGFAGLALLLASVGIYGLLAHMVGQRSREIGLRMALGARRGDILKMILSKGVVLAGAGIAAGVLFSASTASLLGTMLYGVRPHDPAVFLTVPSLLFAVAVLASYLPARRATKVDPIVALREG